MVGDHNGVLVTLSIFIAVAASYTALNTVRSLCCKLCELRCNSPRQCAWVRSCQH